MPPTNRHPEPRPLDGLPERVRIALRFSCIAAWLAFAIRTTVAQGGAAAAPPGAVPTSVPREFLDRSATATRIDRARAPKIDGDLSDAVWAEVPPIGELVQREPVLGRAPSEKTVVKFAHDGKYLYIALYCYDSDPSAIRDTQIRRDSDLEPDDRVEIVVDTMHDHRNAYFFQISPGGSIGDALISNNGSNFNKAWDGIWLGRAKVTKDGWFAELEIPFRTVVTSPQETTWGLNLARYVRRKEEQLIWNHPSYDHQLFRISEAGDLKGLVDVDQGIGLDLVPYARGSFNNNRASNDHDYLFTGGGEAFYRVTPSVTATVTVNTDFAETEVDDRQVNLTRFPLFFPEKRRFFLEDAGIFNFETGGSRGSSDFIPFFSRRVGLDGSGGAIPIDVGTKISGFDGPWSFGFLGVATREKDAFPEKELFAARVRRNLDESNTIGMIATAGNPTKPEDNQVVGVDYRYSTRSMIENRNTDISAFFIKSQTEGVNGNDRAMGAEISYPNDLWRWRVRAREIGDDYNAAMGFTARRGIRTFDGELALAPRPGGDIRRWNFRVSPTVITNLSGETQDAFATFRAAAELLSGDEIGIQTTPAYERVDPAFQIVPGLSVPDDHYSQVRTRAFINTSQRRKIAFGGSITSGKLYGGQSVDVNTSIDWRPGGLFQTGLEVQQNYLRLPGGDADVLVARLRTEVNFSPDVSWQTLAQFDNISESGGLNSRLRWILEPGRDLFVVVNHNWEEIPSRAIVPVGTGIVAKLVFNIRF